MNDRFFLKDSSRNKKKSDSPNPRNKDKYNRNNFYEYEKYDDISDMYDIESDEFSIYSYFQDKSSFIDYQKSPYPKNDIDNLLKINNNAHNIICTTPKPDLIPEKVSKHEMQLISCESAPINFPKPNNKTEESNKHEENASNQPKQRKHTNKKDIAEKLTTTDKKKPTSNSGKKLEKYMHTIPSNEKETKSNKPENAKKQKTEKETEKVTPKDDSKPKPKPKEKNKSHSMSKQAKQQSTVNSIMKFFENSKCSKFEFIKSQPHSKPKETIHHPKQETKCENHKTHSNFDEFIEVSPIPIELKENDIKKINLNANRPFSDSILSQIEHENMIQERIRDQVLSKVVYEPELFIKAMSSDELFLNPYSLKFEPTNYWVNYNMDIKFGEIVNIFFRVNNTRISKFIYKLYNMLLITSKMPLFKAIVGVNWITNRIFSVNVHYFAAMINLAKTSTDAIVNGLGNNIFANYNFVEITPYNYMQIGLSEFPKLENPEIKLMFHRFEKFVNKELSLSELDQIENDNRFNNKGRNRNIIRYHGYPAFS